MYIYHETTMQIWSSSLLIPYRWISGYHCLLNFVSCILSCRLHKFSKYPLCKFRKLQNKTVSTFSETNSVSFILISFGGGGICFCTFFLKCFRCLLQVRTECSNNVISQYTPISTFFDQGNNMAAFFIKCTNATEGVITDLTVR